MQVKVLKDDKGYATQIPYSNGKFKVNNKWVEKGLITTKNKPKIEYFENVTRKLHYEALAPGFDNLSIEDYKKKMAEIERHQILYGDEENRYYREWDNPQSKATYEIFQAAYKLISYQEYVKVCDVELEIYSKIPIDDPYIIPMRCLDQDLFSQKAKYERRSFISFTVRFLLKKYGFIERESSISLNRQKSNEYHYYNHKELTFYIGDKNFVCRWNEPKVVIDNYEVVKEYKKRDEKHIKQVLEDFINTSATAIFRYNLSDLIIDLDKIKSTVAKIDSKNRTHDRYRNAIANIEELKNKINNFAAKEQKNEVS